jgi:nickel-dependent lactate racemase
MSTQMCCASIRFRFLADADAAIEKSLREPIGCVSLREMTRGRESACVVICDVTRSVPNERILTPLLRDLEVAGIARDASTILIATGLHRPNLGSELEDVAGCQPPKL